MILQSLTKEEFAGSFNTNIKLQQEILRTAGIFSSLHSKFSQKYRLQILQNHGNNKCSVFLCFLGPNKKVRLDICAISANTAHLCFSRQSRGRSLSGFGRANFLRTRSQWPDWSSYFWPGPPLATRDSWSPFWKVVFLHRDECAAKVEGLNV